LPGEYNANGFPAHRLDDAATARLLGQEPYRPPRASIRRWSAHEGDHGCLLNTIELPLGLWPWVLRQRIRQAGVQVSLTHAGNLPWIPADSRCCCPNALSLVQEQEHPDAPPDPRCQLASTPLNLPQRQAILRLEFQPCEPRCSLHPTL
jgi:hypothetical protein